MAKVLFGQWFQPGETTNAGASVYTTLAAGGVEGDLEGAGERPVRVAGVVRNLRVRVLTNGITAASKFELRKSTADTGVSVSFSSGETGAKVDSSNSASYATTDEAAVELEAGGSGTSIVWSQISGEFEATSDTVSLIGCNSASSSNFTTASSSCFFTLVGGRNAAGSPEAEANYRARAAFTLGHFAVRTGTITRTTNSTMGTRKNGSNGNASVTLEPTSDSSWLEDNSNTDTIAQGDDFCSYLTNGTGTGNCNIEKVIGALTNTSNQFAMGLGGAAERMNAGVTRYWPVSGSMSSGEESTEANTQIPAPFAFTMKEFCGLVDRVTGAISATMRTRKGGSNGNASLSWVAADVNVTKADTSNTDSVSAADDINYSVVTSGGTNIDFRFVGSIGEVAGSSTVDKTHTTTALLKKTQELSHTGTSLLYKTFDKTHTGDAKLKATLDRQHTTTALLKKLQALSHGSDASLVEAAVATVIFEDHFTAASDGNLEAHTPDTTGTSWSKVGSVTMSVIASSDKTRAAATTASSAALYTCSPVATERDIDVEMKLGSSQPAGMDDPWMLFGRYTDVNNWWSAGAYQDGGSVSGFNVRIVKCVGGTRSNLAQVALSIPVNSTVLLRIRGPETDTTVQLLVDGAVQLEIAGQNEPTLTGRGYGFGLGNNWLSATDDADTAWVFDDFIATQYSSKQEISKIHTTSALLKKPTNKTHTADVNIHRGRIHRTEAFLVGPTSSLVVFEDHFTEASVDTVLESHTPDTVGTSWTNLGAQQLDVKAASDRLGAEAATVASSFAFYRSNPDCVREDVDVVVKMSAPSQPGATDDPWMLFGRMTDIDNWYSGGSYQNANTLNLRIVKCVAGVRTEIASADFDIVQNDVLTLRIRGTASATRVSLLVNGVERLLAPDQNEPTLTGKGHGLGVGNNWTTATDDFNATWIFDDYVVTEFFPDILKSREHTTTALLKKAIDAVHTTTALLKRTSSPTHTTNALTTTATAKTHTTNALTWVDIDPVTGLGPMGVPRPAQPTIPAAPIERDQLHHTDSRLKKVGDRLHATTSLLKKALDRQHTADGNLTATPIRQHATNALLKGARTVLHTVNAFVAVLSRTHSTDARAVRRPEPSHSADARVVRQFERSHTADSLLVVPVQALREHLTNALLRIERTREHLTNSALRKTPTLAHAVDAFLEIVVEAAHTANGYLRRTSSPEHTTTALLRDTNDLAHTTTALLDDASTLHFGTDAHLAGTRELTHTTAAALVLPGTATHTTTALVKKQGDRDMMSDALLRKAGDTAHGTDTRLLSPTDLDHEVDAAVWWTKDLIQVADAVLALPPSEAHTTDAVLRESTAQKTFLRGSFKNIVLKGSL